MTGKSVPPPGLRSRLEELLDEYRATLHDCLDGLTEHEARMRLVPSNTTLLGLVKHVHFVEGVWFDQAITGRSYAEIGIASSPLRSFTLRDADRIESVQQAYLERCAASRRTLADLPMDAIVHGRGERVVWALLLQVLRELAQHAGHADILREQIVARRSDAVGDSGSLPYGPPDEHDDDQMNPHTSGAITEVFTDGACRGNPGPGGWGWAVAPTGTPCGSGGESPSTNQRMEVRAALEAMRNNSGRIEVVSDSTYVVNCINKRWYATWTTNGWRNSQRKPVANTDLWKPFIELYLTRRDEITFRWVKGHSGDPMNELVDQLAVAASAGPYESPTDDNATPSTTLFDD